MRWIFFIVFIFFNKEALALDCPEGFFPVRSHVRNAYIKKDGTTVSSANVKEQCRPYRVLQLPDPKFFSDMPKGWPNIKEKFRSWTKTEETSVREILKTLPNKLTHIGEIKFFRAVSNFSPNPSVSNSEGKIITIYDSIKAHDLKKVVAHELAHIYWDSLSAGEQADYLKKANWIIDSKLQTVSLRRTQLPIPDSAVGPHEDFANNIELFLFDKSLLFNDPEIVKCIEGMLK